MNKSLTLALMASIVFVPMVANAGFQFTAPAGPQSSSNQLMPMPDMAPQMPAVPAPTVQAAPIMNAPTAPAQTQPQPIFTPSAPAISSQPTPSTNNASQNDLAVGFGKDLPIATAMQQVVPEGYTYLVDDNIGGGKTVSWNGGKPWPQVLNDMFKPLGLTTKIDGKIVRVVNPSSTMATQTNVPNINFAPAAPAQAEPVKLASVGDINKNTNMIMFDAPQTNTPYAQNTLNNSGPRNILAQEVRTETIALSSTEPEAIAEMEKSIVPEVTEGQWMAQSGGSLKTVLESWSNLEGVDLFWSADYDYDLIGDVNISGNFEQAVEELLKGFSDASPKPVGRLHPNLPHGPAVLVIETSQINS